MSPKRDTFDIAVVGARVAGSVLATLLGEAGHRVLLLDAATFPSDTVSTHFFRGAGLVSILGRLDVLDEVLALGAPPLMKEYRFTPGGGPEITGPQDPGEVGYGLSVRRLSLDRILLERARRTPGVEIREGTAARELRRRDDGRVIGLVVQQQGVTQEVDARLIVGADGRGSFVARHVDPPVLRREVAARAMYFRYLRDFAPIASTHDGPEFSFRGDELVYAFPSDDAVTCLAISVNLAGFQEFRAGPEAAFTARVRAHPGLRERFDAARFDGRILGSGPKDALIRVAAGPGWALVGDAGLQQDPWTGLGMDNASVHAPFLAEAVDIWLRGRTAEAAALAGYARRRDEHATPGFEFTATGGRDLARL